MIKTMHIFVYSLFLCPILFSLSCSNQPDTPTPPEIKVPVSADSDGEKQLDMGPYPNVSFMTFNVYNLFDTDDDPGKNDEEYMPLGSPEKKRCQGRYKQKCLEKDWTEKALKHHLKNLGAAIRTVNNGKGPDILVLQEVENRKVLERLRVERLLDLGYKPSVLIEGEDQRGIDVGLITRFEVVSQKLHNIRFPWDKDLRTRGILQVTLKLPNGQPLTVLGTHFSSQGKDFEYRLHLFKRMQEIRNALPDSHLVIAAGDFNTIENEFEYLRKYELADWQIAHTTQCPECPEGTYYYRSGKEWNFLDMILVAKDIQPFAVNAGHWQIKPGSVRVENTHPEQVEKTKIGSPRKFSEKRLTGVSDHWPLAMDLEYVAPKEKSEE